MENGKEKLWRAVPFVMAMLLVTLLPLQSASAIFGRSKEAPAAADGAPIAQNMEIRVYRNVPYSGTLKAVDNEGEAVSFAIAEQAKKGSVVIADDGEGFVYTPNQDKIGVDKFTYTATDESGNVSLPATVKISIERTNSAVNYADMNGNAAETAAVDLAEHGVFVGTKVGESYFFEPERTLSRGEFIAMAMAATGQEVSAVSVTGFCDDESIPTWCKGYAVSALSSGVIYGVETEEGIAFDANSEITLNEAAVVLNRLLSVTDVDLSSYNGMEAENAWCAQAVANLQSVSILQSGRFSSDEMRRGVTRETAAELLSAAMTLQEGRRSDHGLIGELLG